MANAWQTHGKIIEKCVANARRTRGKWTANAWIIGMANARQTHGKRTGRAWQMHGICTANAWQTHG
eukprot:8986527-Lingulodinium_polyedra.AAC.1